MKYRIVDADNRAEYSKPKTFEAVLKDEFSIEI